MSLGVYKIRIMTSVDDHIKTSQLVSLILLCFLLKRESVSTKPTKIGIQEIIMNPQYLNFVLHDLIKNEKVSP